MLQFRFQMVCSCQNDLLGNFNDDPPCCACFADGQRRNHLKMILRSHLNAFFAGCDFFHIILPVILHPLFQMLSDNLRLIAGSNQNAICTDNSYPPLAGKQLRVRPFYHVLNKIQPKIHAGNAMKGISRHNRNHQRDHPDIFALNQIRVRIRSAFLFLFARKQVVITFADPVIIFILILIIFKRLRHNFSRIISVPVGNKPPAGVMSLGIDINIIKSVQRVRLPAGINTCK